MDEEPRGEVPMEEDEEVEEQVRLLRLFLIFTKNSLKAQLLPLRSQGMTIWLITLDKQVIE